MQLSIEFQARVRVPENAFEGDAPLVAVMRGEFVGSLHHGSFAVAETDGRLVASLGNPHERVFLRSAAKPFQVMPAVLSGALEQFEITEEELAVLCASHNGEPRHVTAVLSVLNKIGLEESSLRCGIHPPLHEATVRQLISSGRPATASCNNCSGAHAGMLLACKARGWPLDSYGRPDHPLQVLTGEILATFAGVQPAEVDSAVDNCAVPTFRLPLVRSAVAFARLATGRAVHAELAESAQRVVRAMTGYPVMVAGEDRFDTDLMRASGGSIVAKGGAEGFQGLGLRAQQLGVALKITDGNSWAVPPAAIRILSGIGALATSQIDALNASAEPQLMNLQDEPVGRLVPVFDLRDFP